MRVIMSAAAPSERFIMGLPKITTDDWRRCISHYISRDRDPTAMSMSDARSRYFIRRNNFHDSELCEQFGVEYLTDFPDSILNKIDHGAYEWQPVPGVRTYQMEFTEGPLAKAFMEDLDYKYLSAIASGYPDLFLKEMTSKSELSKEDRGDPYYDDFGLDLSLEHHRSLQRKFATDVARIQAARGLMATTGGGAAAASLVNSGVTSASATVDSSELSRLREEMVRLREAAARVPVVPFREINASDVEYILDEKGKPKRIGEGNFGEVLAGRYAGVSVAVKCLKVTALNSAEQGEFRSEAMVHANMRHPNIVMLLAVCMETGHFALVMEYMTGGSLYSLLHSGFMLSWSQRIDMAKQLVAGVMYLHNLADHIVHRDLKSANVLVARPYREEDERVEIKISDFGLAKIKDASSSTSKVGVAGTIAWLPPEAFDDTPALTKKSDIYSLGMVFWELASRDIPYAGLAIGAMMRKISMGQTNAIPTGTPEGFSAIIQDCWKFNPSERPTARDLMPRVDALAAGFFGGGAGAGAGGGEASAAGPMYGSRPNYY